MLSGILFVLYTGISWEHLPQELGFGSGMTCWRRLRDWHAAGVWQHLHELLPAELPAAAVDSARARAEWPPPPTAQGAVRRQRLRPRQVPADGLGHRRQAGIHEAFMALGAAIICWRRLAR